MKVIYIVFIFIVLGCAGKSVYDEQTYSEFPENKLLTGRDIILSDSIFFTTPDIFHIDSLCCIFDQSAKDYYCHIFSFPEFEYKYSLIKCGRGENEIMNPVPSLKIKDKYLYIANRNPGQILKYDLTDNSNIPKERFLINDVIDNFALLNDSVFAVTSISPKEKFRIKIYNKYGKKIDSLLSIPKVERLKPSNVSDAQIWYSLLDYDTLHKRLITITVSGEVLEVIDYPGEKYYIQVGAGQKPQFAYRGKTAIIPGRIVGFNKLKVVGDKIYTLFSPTLVEDLIWNKAEEVFFIQQYDNIGKPNVKYTTDRLITSFFIDEENKKIYATDRESPYMLSEFSLP